MAGPIREDRARGDAQAPGRGECWGACHPCVQWNKTQREAPGVGWLQSGPVGSREVEEGASLLYPAEPLALISLSWVGME